MQAFLAPLAELAEYKEIFGRRKKNSGSSADYRLRQFPENTFDVCTERWLLL